MHVCVRVRWMGQCGLNENGLSQNGLSQLVSQPMATQSAIRMQRLRNSDPDLTAITLKDKDFAKITYEGNPMTLPVALAVN